MKTASPVQSSNDSFVSSEGSKIKLHEDRFSVFCHKIDKVLNESSSISKSHTHSGSIPKSIDTAIFSNTSNSNSNSNSKSKSNSDDNGSPSSPIKHKDFITFDRFLSEPINENRKLQDRYAHFPILDTELVAVPSFLCGLMLALTEKFRTELNQTDTFLEKEVLVDKKKLNKIISKVEKGSSLEDIKNSLSNYSSGEIFATLVAILEKNCSKLFPASTASVNCSHLIGIYLWDAFDSKEMTNKLVNEISQFICSVIENEDVFRRPQSRKSRKSTVPRANSIRIKEGFTPKGREKVEVLLYSTTRSKSFYKSKIPLEANLAESRKSMLAFPLQSQIDQDDKDESTKSQDTPNEKLDTTFVSKNSKDKNQRFPQGGALNFNLNAITHKKIFSPRRFFHVREHTDLYFRRDHLGYEKKIELFNRFNCYILADLDKIPDTLSRNVLVYIIRNCIHMIRLNALNKLGTERHMKKEDISSANLTILAHNLYKMTNIITKQLGPILVKLHHNEHFNNDDAVIFLSKVFLFTADKLWYRETKPADLTRVLNNIHCHKNCLCGWK